MSVRFYFSTQLNSDRHLWQCRSLDLSSGRWKAGNDCIGIKDKPWEEEARRAGFSHFFSAGATQCYEIIGKKSFYKSRKSAERWMFTAECLQPFSILAEAEECCTTVERTCKELTKSAREKSPSSLVCRPQDTICDRRPADPGFHPSRRTDVWRTLFTNEDGVFLS